MKTHKDSPSQRRALLAAELRRQGARCAIISNPKHIYYFSGVPTNLHMWFTLMKGPRLTSLLLVDLEGRAALLAGRRELHDLGAGRSRLELGVTDYVDYSLSQGMAAYGDRLAAEMKKWLRALGSRYDSVAVEEWHLPGTCRDVLRALQPGSRLVGVSGFLLSMRNSKGRDEIRRLEAAARTADGAYKVARGAAEPGRTELDVYADVNSGSFRRDGSFAWVVGDYASGERSVIGGGGPTRRKLRRGDTIILDLQTAYENYWSDLCRTFVVGSAPKRSQEKILTVLKEAKSAAEAILVPGTKGREVYAEVCAALEKRGYPRLPHHAGHGIGLDDQEPPWFIPAEERRLEEGTVCVVEPGIYREDTGGIRIEDQYLVTGKGPRKLSHYPLGLS